MDQHALRELHLYMENDGDVRRRLTRDFIPNLDKKAKTGKYDRTKVPKLFLYLVDFGAEKYLKEFGDVESGARPRDPTAIKRAARRMFPTELRMKLSEMLRDEYEEEAKERGVDLGFCDSCSHKSKLALGDGVAVTGGTYHGRKGHIRRVLKDSYDVKWWGADGGSNLVAKRDVVPWTPEY